MENENNMTQPQTQYVVVKKKSKAKWIILALIVVIVIAVVGASGGEKEDSAVIKPIDGSNVSSDGGQKQDTSNIKVGSSVSDGDIKVSFLSCNTDFTDYSKYSKPDEGYKIIEVVFDFENTSDTDQSVGYFECYADGVKCEYFYGVDGSSSPSYESIAAGRRLGESKMYYEVPENAEKIELEYECDMFDDEKYIFIVE